MSTYEDPNDGRDWRSTPETFQVVSHLMNNIERLCAALEQSGQAVTEKRDLLEYIDLRYAEMADPAVSDTLAFINDPVTKMTATRRQIEAQHDGGRLHDHLAIEWRSPSNQRRRVIAQFDEGRSSSGSRYHQPGSDSGRSMQLISITSTGDVRLFVNAIGSPGGTAAAREHFAPLMRTAAELARTPGVDVRESRDTRKATWIQKPTPSTIAPTLDALVHFLPDEATTDPPPPSPPGSGSSALKTSATNQLQVLKDGFDTHLGRRTEMTGLLWSLGFIATWLDDSALAAKCHERAEIMDSLRDTKRLQSERRHEALEAAIRTRDLAAITLDRDDPLWIDIFGIVGICQTDSREFDQAIRSLDEAIRMQLERGESPEEREDNVGARAHALRRSDRAVEAVEALEAHLSSVDRASPWMHCEFVHSLIGAGETARAAEHAKLIAGHTSTWSEADLRYVITTELFHTEEMLTAMLPTGQARTALLNISADITSLIPRIEELDSAQDRMNAVADVSRCITRIADCYSENDELVTSYILLNAACRVMDSNNASSLTPALFERRIRQAMLVQPEAVPYLLNDYIDRIPMFDGARDTVVRLNASSTPRTEDFVEAVRSFAGALAVETTLGRAPGNEPTNDVGAQGAPRDHDMPSDREPEGEVSHEGTDGQHPPTRRRPPQRRQVGALGPPSDTPTPPSLESPSILGGQAREHGIDRDESPQASSSSPAGADEVVDNDLTVQPDDTPRTEPNNGDRDVPDLT